MFVSPGLTYSVRIEYLTQRNQGGARRAGDIRVVGYPVRVAG